MKKIADWLIKRRKKQLHTPVVIGSASMETLEFRRVLNTLRENKVMVKVEDDGVYIRMAGVEDRGECFSLEWAKVRSF